MAGGRGDGPKSDDRTAVSRAPSSSRPSRFEDGGTADLTDLRRQVQRLAVQLQEHATSSAASLVGRAREGVNEVATEVSSRGQEAVAGVREVGNNFTRAIDGSLEKRPYTTLAVAFGMGFLFTILNR
jgi:ElaB/YqjD/DUF883 family membrane-anchored ribosome-binding protein